MPIRRSANFNLDNLVKYVLRRLQITPALLEQAIGNELDLAQYLVDETLVTYSLYKPYTVNIILGDQHKSDRVGYYTINRDELPTEIFGINRVVGYLADPRLGGITNTGFSELSHYVKRGSSGTFPDSLLDQLISRDVLSANTLGVIAQFNPPNEIEMFPKGWYNGMILVLNTMHPPSLQTVNVSTREIIRKLAVADAAIAIRPYVNRFQEISAPGVTINLNTDILEKAEDSREELIEKLKRGTFKGGSRKRIYVG